MSIEYCPDDEELLEILEELEAEGMVTSKVENGKRLWRITELGIKEHLKNEGEKENECSDGTP